MSDSDISSLNLDELRVEIGRLQQELTETNQEKIRAAEYGLAVLEERNHLESQIEEFETTIHALKTELDQAKEVSRGLTCVSYLHGLLMMTNVSLVGKKSCHLSETTGS